MQKEKMKSLELKTFPDNCLRIKTSIVELFEDNLAGVVHDMADIMYINQGIGLAATQVGLDISILTIDVGEGLMTLVNPRILSCSDELDGMEEGCLSLPRVNVNVHRPKTIEMEAYDIYGKKITGKFDGLLAKVILHELDHLNGKLLIDYMNPVNRWMVSARLTKIKKQL